MALSFRKNLPNGDIMWIRPIPNNRSYYDDTLIPANILIFHLSAKEDLPSFAITANTCNGGQEQTFEVARAESKDQIWQIWEHFQNWLTGGEGIYEPSE
jgi:hypothetical protein